MALNDATTGSPGASPRRSADAAVTSAVSGPTRTRKRFPTAKSDATTPGRWLRADSSTVAIRASVTSHGWTTTPTRPDPASVESRAELEARVADAEARFGDDPPLPESWGGLRVVPDAYEFWVHDENRLHDRFRYERDGDGWRIRRLGP